VFSPFLHLFLLPSPFIVGVSRLVRLDCVFGLHFFPFLRLLNETRGPFPFSPVAPRGSAPQRMHASPCPPSHFSLHFKPRACDFSSYPSLSFFPVLPLLPFSFNFLFFVLRGRGALTPCLPLSSDSDLGRGFPPKASFRHVLSPFPF